MITTLAKKILHFKRYISSDSLNLSQVGQQLPACSREPKVHHELQTAPEAAAWVRQTKLPRAQGASVLLKLAHSVAASFLGRDETVSPKNRGVNPFTVFAEKVLTAGRA